MRNFSAAQEIADINAAGRETVSKTENAAHRHAEDVARADRLRKDRLIRRGLRALLWGGSLRGARENAEVGELLNSYAYLDSVPPEAFDVR